MCGDGQEVFLAKKTPELCDDRRISTAVRMHHDLGQNEVARHAEDASAAAGLNDRCDNAEVALVALQEKNEDVGVDVDTSARHPGDQGVYLSHSCRRLRTVVSTSAVVAPQRPRPIPANDITSSDGAAG